MSSVNIESQQQQHQQQQQRRWYLLMDNPSKTNHLGTLLRCAAAFQCHQVLLVGYDKFNWQGSFGSHIFLDIVVFPTWDSVREYLMRGGDDDDANNASNDTTTSTNGICANNKELRKPITIMGILGAYGGGDEIFSADGMPVYTYNSYASIVPPRDNDGYTNTANNSNSDRKQYTTAKFSQHRSFPIDKRPFTSYTTCFILSKDRNGLPTSQAQMCSGFVHVPHLSFDSNEVPATCIDSSTTAQPNASTSSAITQSNLMDTATTLSIVLHHYTAWAEYKERTFEENQKFTKDIKPNARRRLCRVYGQDNKQQKHDVRNTVNDKTAEGDSENEHESLGAMSLLFNEDTGNASQRSDY